VPAAALTTTDEQRVSVTFVEENAGFLNTLVYYVVDDAGNFVDVGLVFANVDGPDRGGGPLAGGETVEIGTFAADTMLGFALLQDAYSKGYDLEAAASRSAPPMTARPGSAIPPRPCSLPDRTRRQRDPDRRADLPHRRSDPRRSGRQPAEPGRCPARDLGIDSGGGVVLGFEDVVSTAGNFDGDYNDAIFRVVFEDATPAVIDPVQDVESPPVILPDGQEVALRITTELTTDDDTAELSGVISLTGFLASNVNIAFVNDASGSTFVPARDADNNFIDLDGDGFADSVFEVQVAAFLELARQITAAGLGDAPVAWSPSASTRPWMP
jgi:hypothetical protein